MRGALEDVSPDLMDTASVVCKPLFEGVVEKQAFAGRLYVCFYGRLEKYRSSFLIRHSADSERRLLFGHGWLHEQTRSNRHVSILVVDGRRQHGRAQ